MSEPTAPPLALPRESQTSAMIRALGFDPATIQAVILTPTSAVAIAADYPEPYIPPQEA